MSGGNAWYDGRDYSPTVVVGRPRTGGLTRVLLDVAECRTRQDEQYGQHNDTLGPDGWLGVLAREFCEAGNEANEHYKGRARSTDKLRAELVDVAAVAVAWIEAIDRKAASE